MDGVGTTEIKRPSNSIRKFFPNSNECETFVLVWKAYVHTYIKSKFN